MLIDTITFQMHNTDDTFLVPDTEDNYALIAGNRYTRQIKFTQTFSFQFDKEKKAPGFMIEALVNEYLATVEAMEESEQFVNDEMVGAY